MLKNIIVDTYDSVSVDECNVWISNMTQDTVDGLQNWYEVKDYKDLNQLLYDNGWSVGIINDDENFMLFTYTPEVPGKACKNCNEYYPDAISNQEDGSLICWACRNGWN